MGRSTSALLLFLAILSSSCAGVIRGKLFIDENQNGFMDSSESPLPSAAITILRNGKAIASAKTDPSGEFEIGHARTATYCIQVDVKAAAEILPSLGLGRKAGVTKALSLDGAAAPDEGSCADADSDGKCDGGCADDDKDGFCDNVCLDADGDKRCDDDNAGLHADVPSDGRCADKDRDGNCDRTCADADHDAACDGGASQAADEKDEKGAKEAGWGAEGFCFVSAGRNMDVAIPVHVDYAAASADISGQPAISCDAEEACAISIPIPKGCRLKPLELPDYLSSTMMGRGAGGRTAGPKAQSIAASKAEGQADDDEDEAEAAGSSVPTISPKQEAVSVQLKVREEIPFGTLAVTILPVALCGSSEVELAAIPLSIVRDADVGIFLDMRGEPGAGKTVTVRATLENMGKGQIERGELMIELQEGMRLISADRPCHNLGQRAQCPVQSFKGESRQLFQATVLLPQEPPSPPAMKIGARFTIEGLEGATEAEPIEFSM